MLDHNLCVFFERVCILSSLLSCCCTRRLLSLRLPGVHQQWQGKESCTMGRRRYCCE